MVGDSEGTVLKVHTLAILLEVSVECCSKPGVHKD